MKLSAGRRACGAMLAGCATSAATQPAASAQAAMAMPEITIYHLEGRRSERIVWLMEELGLPYKLVFKRGDLAGSMAEIREGEPRHAGGADRDDRRSGADRIRRHHRDDPQPLRARAS